MQRNTKKTTDEFIQEAKTIHGNKYNYSKVNYVNAKTKVCIICPKHGEFWQTPSSHLGGRGCPECKKDKLHNQKVKSKEQFVIDSQKIHNNKYDYSKVNYVNNHTKVCIVCPEHGEFWQTPHSHLSGDGCSKCSKKHKYTTEEWIQLAKEIHGDTYDYSKVNYVSAHKKVCIICPEHGEFWQTPSAHVNSHMGCPKFTSSRLEETIRLVLQENNIKYEEQKTYDWLKTYKGQLKLDFFLPEYNIAIECQGIQHFEQTWFGGINGKRKNYHLFENTIKRDLKKFNLCKEHNIKLLYFTDVQRNEYPYNVITDIDIIKKSLCL